MKNILRKMYTWSSFPSLILLISFIIINLIINPNFFNPLNIGGFLSYNVPLVCVSIGIAVVLLSGGIDISVGAIVCLVNVVFITLIGKGFGITTAILCSLISAITIGSLNGVIISIFRVTPLLTTFATSSIAAGLALWIMPIPGGSAPMEFISWYNSFALGLPVPLFFIILCITFWILIKITPLGVWIYAVGQNERKAFVSSIPVTLVKFFVYVFSSLLAGIGGIALTGSIGSGDPLAGLPISLNAIAACVIGGISLYGGQGNVIGSVFGSLFLGLVITAVQGANIPSFYQDLASGLIILTGIIGASMVMKLKLFTKKNYKEA
jgi:ribose transport system permease protein